MNAPDAINVSELRPRSGSKKAAPARGRAAAGSVTEKGQAQPGKPHVVIVGAGLAGLCAAYRLQEAGCSYTILEADKVRVGGRAFTARFSDGLYGELGAMRIPTQHTTTLKYIDAFKLPTRKFVLNSDNAFVYARGQCVRRSDVRTLTKYYEMRSWECTQTPDQLWAYAVDGHIDTLTEEERKDLRESNSFKTKKIYDLDHMSVRQLIDRSGLSGEAIEYLLVGTGNRSLQHIAATEFLREDLLGLWSDDNFQEIVGGTDCLPKAFLGRLQVEPRMNCQVVALQQDEKRTTAVYHTVGGGQDQVSGDFLLCAIPFPALDRMDFPPGMKRDFSGGKSRAIREAWYESSIKILVPTTRRFWELDKIYGGVSNTDLLVGSIHYPSDNAQERYADVSHGPGVLLLSYNWGADARRLGTLTKTQREHLAVHVAASVHPELREDGVVRWDEVTSWPWDNHPWAGAAFAFYLPGQFANLHQDVIAPEGRIYFAGEHCSRAQTWMQGALESAENAVTAMLAEWEQAQKLDTSAKNPSFASVS
jgi:monoamine oxidase